MMMIPEAWENPRRCPSGWRTSTPTTTALMEPWDGPAAVVFCDGTVLGATLDRNGLRPGRWQMTDDDFVVLASETGVLEYPAEKVVRKGRLQPGRIFLVDVEEGRIVEDAELKHEIAHQQPYGDWYRENSVHLDDIPDVAPRDLPADPMVTRQLMFGYSQEDLRVTLRDMGGVADGRADRLDGQRLRARRPLRRGTAALPLLQAALRPGHQPADRPDPREAS